MKKLNADVVIIGGGGAGLVAALTAIQKGIKNVIVLEKRFKVGGNSSMAGGMIFAAESKIQKSMGIDINKDKVFRDTMAFHHYEHVNPRIVRAFIDKSASTIEWLESLGESFDYKMNVHIIKGITTPFGGFSRVTKMLGEKIKAAGGQVLTKTQAESIKRSPDGSVNGVVAINKDGEKLQIKTKSVILTSGGFTGNNTLLKKYFPKYWGDVYWTDAIPLDGDGIKLAESAGAGVDDFCTLIRENGYCFDRSGKMPNRIHMEKGAVWVNKNGIRYADETVHENPATNALLAQPGKIAFALFDDKLIKIAGERPNPMANIHTSDKKEPVLKETLMQESKSGKWCIAADNWADVAKWIGAQPAVLEQTIKEYNSFCNNGSDSLFAKDKEALLALKRPPFYAVKFRPLMIDTAGPVKINQYMEVLDNADKPLPGFYAAGVITSGWQGNDYRIFGSALGYSLNSGRIAGENAAKYLAAEQ
ncbi:MAG: FAD-dependent oxidoreductase [Dehalococcoidia bacterium]|nr:MAG: FAD-dependent oxidoreductase [Dehalococcoidia bacterium]